MTTHQLPPSPPRRLRREKTEKSYALVWLIFTGLLGLIIGAAAVSLVGSTTSSGTAHSNACIAALDGADEVIDLYNSAFYSAADGMAAARTNDLQKITRASDEIGDYAGDIEYVLRSYYTHSNDCRG